AGLKTIRVINPDGQEAILENAFTYDPFFAVDPQRQFLTTFGEVKHTTLLQNYPNPFNPETWLPYALAEAADVTLRIYNLSGELVRTLAIGRQSAGVYLSRDGAVYWDGRDDAGQSVASGVYFYQLVAGEYKQTRRMVLMK
ncbi:MAG: T9SS type A sorting domain-containing protein, partial [Candidatus Poribacteria bacterium]|nr:T9SS type A sorting domain-containing protein [Candidatus Poribacteria bacterium]